MVTWYWSPDNLIWQVSIDHNMMSYISKEYKENQGGMSLSTYYLEYGRHLARLHRHRCHCANVPTSNTASHDNHEKINSWVSFNFLYGYRAPLGGPSGRRSYAIIATNALSPCFHERCLPWFCFYFTEVNFLRRVFTREVYYGYCLPRFRN